MGEIKVNVGGSWKTASSVMANINGTWTSIKEGWCNIGGTWKQFLASSIDVKMGIANGTSVTPAVNGDFGGDFRTYPVTTVGGYSVYFKKDDLSETTFLEMYIFSDTAGSEAKTGKLTVSISLPSYSGSGFTPSSSDVSALAGSTTPSSITVNANGPLVLVWNSVTIPAYNSTRTTSNTLPVTVTVSSSFIESVEGYGDESTANRSVSIDFE